MMLLRVLVKYDRACLSKATEVKLSLNRLVKEYKKEKMSFYEEKMMKHQREEELEELRKHDPNT
jgi:hypothetical protein